MSNQACTNIVDIVLDKRIDEEYSNQVDREQAQNIVSEYEAYGLTGSEIENALVQWTANHVGVSEDEVLGWDQLDDDHYIVRETVMIGQLTITVFEDDSITVDGFGDSGCDVCGDEMDEPEPMPYDVSTPMETVPVEVCFGLRCNERVQEAQEQIGGDSSDEV